MVKIKLIVREDEEKLLLNVEPLINKGSTKEQKIGVLLLAKIEKMLAEIEKELNK